jgi:hypothetical protein
MQVIHIPTIINPRERDSNQPAGWRRREREKKQRKKAKQELERSKEPEIKAQMDHPYNSFHIPTIEKSPGASERASEPSGG